MMSLCVFPQFNSHTFKLEEKCYQDERIKFDHVHYIDNQPVLDLIEQRPNGLLPSIDEELRMPKGSDRTWVDKLIVTHKSTANFAPDRASASCFVVKHYAGAVVYDSAGFLDKNKDQLNDDAYALLQTSAFKFLASLFPTDAGMNGGGSGLSKKISLGTKFTRQLAELMTALNLTEPHYIRCIKPNPNKAQLQYEGQMVYEQLTYSGVFEAITIRKQGFPFRLTHADFFQRYKVHMNTHAHTHTSGTMPCTCACTSAAPHPVLRLFAVSSPQCLFPNTHRWSGDNIANCRMLIGEMKQSLTQVQIGTTKVLYRAEQVSTHRHDTHGESSRAQHTQQIADARYLVCASFRAAPRHGVASQPGRGGDRVVNQDGGIPPTQEVAKTTLQEQGTSSAAIALACGGEQKESRDNTALGCGAQRSSRASSGFSVARLESRDRFVGRS